jgi:leucyl aminopeptidase (aminopeptidase T)
MRDPRFNRLAEILTGYSTELKRNEKVLIEAFDAPDEITIALIRAARKRGAIPFVQLQRAPVSRELALHATESQLRLLTRHELARMKQIDAYIAVRGSHNITEQADVPTNQMKLIARKMRPGSARSENEVGSAAMADSGHGPARQHEHGSFRRFFLRSLHARLPQASAGNERA